MLQAVARKKLTYLFKQREVSSDQPQHKRRVEDMIFASVFGVIPYFKEEHCRAALRVLLPRDSSDPLLQAILASGRISRARFWPSYSHIAKTRVEPDAVIDFATASGAVRLIIEAKWDSQFQEDQVTQQWQAATRDRDDPFNRCRQLLVVKTAELAKDHYSAAYTAGLIPAPIVQTWHAIARALTSIAANDRSAEGRWATDVLALLNEFGERIFSGFEHLLKPANAPAQSHPTQRQAIFYADHRFVWGPAPRIVAESTAFLFGAQNDGRPP